MPEIGFAPQALGIDPVTGVDNNMLEILAKRRLEAAKGETMTPGMREILLKNTATGKKGAIVAGLASLSGGLQGYFNRADAATESKKLDQAALNGADFLRKSDPRFAKYPPGVLEKALRDNPTLIGTLTGKAFEQQNWQIGTRKVKDRFNNETEEQFWFNPHQPGQTLPMGPGGAASPPGAPGAPRAAPAVPAGFAPPGSPQATVPQAIDSQAPLTPAVNAPAAPAIANPPPAPAAGKPRVLGQVVPGPDEAGGNAAWAAGGGTPVFGQPRPPQDAGGPPLPPQRPPELGLSPGLPVAMAPNPDIDPVKAAQAGSDRLLRQQYPERAVTEEQALRKEAQANENYVRFAKSAPILNSMRKNWKNSTAVSDYDFVYGFAQILDPTSAVRDQEQRMLSAAQSAPEAIRGMIMKTLTGEGKLEPEQRRKVMDFLHNRVSSYKDQASSDFEQLGETTKAYGYAPERVVPRLTGLMSREDFFKDDNAPAVVPPTEETPEQRGERLIRERQAAGGGG